MFNLPAILALAADTAANTTTLSPETINIILTATAFMEDMSQWEGAGDELTTEEIDQIKAMVGQVVNEVAP